MNVEIKNLNLEIVSALNSMYEDASQIRVFSSILMLVGGQLDNEQREWLSESIHQRAQLMIEKCDHYELHLQRAANAIESEGDATQAVK